MRTELYGFDKQGLLGKNRIVSPMPVTRLTLLKMNKYAANEPENELTRFSELLRAMKIVLFNSEAFDKTFWNIELDR